MSRQRRVEVYVRGSYVCLEGQMEKVDLRAARQKHPAWSSSWARPRREVGLGTLFTITSELQSGVSTCLAQLTNCSLCSLHRHRHSSELLAHDIVHHQSAQHSVRLSAHGHCMANSLTAGKTTRFTPMPISIYRHLRHLTVETQLHVLCPYC